MKFEVGNSDMSSSSATVFIILLSELANNHPEIDDEESLEILITINGISVDFQTVFERYDDLIQETLSRVQRENSKAIKKLQAIKGLLESDDDES